MALSMTSTALRLPGSSRAVFQPARTNTGRRISFVVRAEQSLGDKIEEKTKVRLIVRTLSPCVRSCCLSFANTYQLIYLIGTKVFSKFEDQFLRVALNFLPGRIL